MTQRNGFSQVMVTNLSKIKSAVDQSGRRGIAARDLSDRLRIPRPIVNQMLTVLQSEGSVRAGSDWMFFSIPKRQQQQQPRA